MCPREILKSCKNGERDRGSQIQDVNLKKECTHAHGEIVILILSFNLNNIQFQINYGKAYSLKLEIEQQPIQINKF